MGEPQTRLLADALAAPLKGARDAWIAQRKAAIDGRVTRETAARESERAARERKEGLQRRLEFAGVLIGGTIAYVMVAQMAGRWVASGLLWLIGMFYLAPAGWTMVSSKYPDSWGGIVALPVGLLLMLVPTLAALTAGFLYGFVARLWTDGEYRVRVLWGIAALLAIIALELLLELFRRIF